ncbi:murein biosynthesis integral membrane protein MurJ [Clostridium sp. C8-1-8]|uniref:murein biosynthesis integral membrane protein MurJ n=1 Tax=Clostridium sp. C8-1-8 TaxID=2698831 RepID=UPI00136A3D06|nr:murein biosynthesis integral membrane protein MurJ [Clostridium sp. C8-1-8]
MERNNNARIAVMISILTIMNSLLGFVRESIIASVFGITFSSDIYVFTNGLINMIFSNIGGALSIAFIPTLAAILQKDDDEGINNLVNNVLNIVLLIIIPVMVICIIFSKQVVGIFGPGFVKNCNAAQLSSAIEATRIMFISLIFIGVQNVFVSVLFVHKKLLISSVINISSNVIVILYLVTGGRQFGSTGLIVAQVVGCLVQMLITFPPMRKVRYRYKFIVDFKDEELRKIFKKVIPIFVGTSVAQINFIITRMLASNIGEGTIATLNYADKLSMYVYTIIGSAITTVIYAQLSLYSAQNNREQLKKTVIKAINLMNLIIIPTILGMMLLRVPLITLVFKRGMFNSKATLLTASVLLFYAPGVIAYGVRDIVNKTFYSIHNTLVPIINSIIGVVINIALNLLLANYLGIYGLALANTISGVTITILLIISVNKHIKFGIGSIFKPFSKIAFSSIAMGFSVWLINKLLLNRFYNNIKELIISLGISFVVGVSVYVIFVNLTNVQEFTIIKDEALKKVRRYRLKFVKSQ